MTDIVKGLDVSVYQHLDLIDWGKAHAVHRICFAFARATYGTVPDKLTVGHISRIRSAGIVPGCYHFFRPDQQNGAQLAAFQAVAEQCGLGPGDLLPAIDCEAFPDQWIAGKPKRWAQPNPDWCLRLQDLLTAFTEAYGGAIVYITQADWAKLGKPTWLLDYPQWVAHWPSIGATSPLTKPATPGNVDWAIWQQMVGPLGRGVQDPDAPGAVDQDVGRLPLPLIEDRDIKLEDPELVPFERDRPGETAERDRTVRES